MRAGGRLFSRRLRRCVLGLQGVVDSKADLVAVDVDDRQKLVADLDDISDG